MPNMLLINASPKGDASSRKLTATFVKEWSKKFPGNKIVERDVGLNPIPHLLNDSVEGIIAPNQETETGKKTRALSDKLIAELNEADVIVFGVPMHNFTVPSSLKAYFDHIARRGVTSGNNLEFGKNKQVVVITTGGGPHQDSPRDFQGPYIKHFLSFINLKDVQFIRAHELLMGKGQEIIAKAEAEIVEYISKLPAPEPVHSAQESNQHILSRLTSLSNALTATNQNKPEIKVRMANFDSDQSKFQEICSMVNNAYDNAETGLWKVKAHRANLELLSEFIQKNELLLAEVDNKIVGCIYVKFLDKENAEFGMLAVDPNYRNSGIGTKLIASVESWAAQNDRATMNLKLVMPADGKHENKEFLKSWYSRIGYEIQSSEPFEKIEPHKQDMLATPCNFVHFSKDIKGLSLENKNNNSSEGSVQRYLDYGKSGESNLNVQFSLSLASTQSAQEDHSVTTVTTPQGPLI